MSRDAACKPPALASASDPPSGKFPARSGSGGATVQLAARTCGSIVDVGGEWRKSLTVPCSWVCGGCLAAWHPCLASAASCRTCHPGAVRTAAVPSSSWQSTSLSALCCQRLRQAIIHPVQISPITICSPPAAQTRALRQLASPPRLRPHTFQGLREPQHGQQWRRPLLRCSLRRKSSTLRWVGQPYPGCALLSLQVWFRRWGYFLSPMVDFLSLCPITLYSAALSSGTIFIWRCLTALC